MQKISRAPSAPPSFHFWIRAWFLRTFWGVFNAKSVGFWGGAPDPGGGAYSAPPHPLAGWEGCPPPAPSPGRPRLLLRPTPRHTLAGAPPPPPLPIPGSATASVPRAIITGGTRGTCPIPDDSLNIHECILRTARVRFISASVNYSADTCTCAREGPIIKYDYDYLCKRAY